MLSRLRFPGVLNALRSSGAKHRPLWLAHQCLFWHFLLQYTAFLHFTHCQMPSAPHWAQTRAGGAAEPTPAGAAGACIALVGRRGSPRILLQDLDA